MIGRLIDRLNRWLERQILRLEVHNARRAQQLLKQLEGKGSK